MRKVGIAIALLLIVVQVIFGQEKVYLPLILKSGHGMADLAVLEISDGVTTVDLINEKNGFHLVAWNPAIAGAKDGGTFQSSSLASSRRLVNRVFGNANEVMTLHVNSHSQDALIYHLQELVRLLEKAIAYWTTDWSNVTIGSQLQNAPVWIKAQANCETSPRYALIHFYELPSLTNPYAQPFFSASNIVAMNELTLALERGHWLADKPGESTCVEASGIQDWIYSDSWSTKATPAASFIRSFVQLANGKILAGETGDIYESTDDGDSWGLNTSTPAGNVNSLLLLKNGFLLAGDDGQILRSIDGGVGWGVVTASPTSFVYDMVQLTNGRVLATDFGQVFKSDNNGATWSIASTAFNGSVRSLLQLPSGRVLAGELGLVWHSDDNGDNWNVLSSDIPALAYDMIRLSTGELLLGTLGYIYRSIDDGFSWTIAYTSPIGGGTSELQDLLQLADDSIMANETQQIVHSTDLGFSWSVTTTAPATQANGLIQTQAESVLSGDFTDINKYSPDPASMGRAITCNDEVYVANKQNIANLTHIKIDDGGVFTDIFPISSFPLALLPATPAANDAIYFGIQTSASDSGPFSNLVFDIDTVAISTTSFSTVWEYSDGVGGWPALTIRDNTDGASTAQGALSAPNVNSVHWRQPGDWVAESVDAITALWVRLRVSALTGTLTPPTQQNRDIYAIVFPYVDIADNQVLGDITALAQIKPHNQSDEDSRGGSGPDLWDNRLLIALRSYDRGENFQAYLNVADEQNPVGVIVAATGANTAFAADVTTPTGRRTTYNPAGVEAMATQVTISLGPSIARDFYGVFHAFLRVQRTAGASTDFDVQLQIVSGSGGVSFTTPSKQIQTTTAFEVLDFGRVTIPASGALQLSNLGDTTEIRIQASAASGTPNLNMYDLVLIPTDEWAIDAVDYANDSDSVIGRVDDVQRLLDIDSVTNPRIPINAIVRDVGSELVASIYNPITNGEAILQANEQQRLWFFAMQTSATGTSYNWIAPPEIAHSIQVFHNARYLSMRGER